MGALTLLSALLLMTRLASSILPHTVSVEKVSPVRVVIREVNTSHHSGRKAMSPDNVLSDIHKRQIFHLMHHPALYASKSVERKLE